MPNDSRNMLILKYFTKGTTLLHFQVALVYTVDALHYRSAHPTALSWIVLNYKHCLITVSPVHSSCLSTSHIAHLITLTLLLRINIIEHYLT